MFVAETNAGTPFPEEPPKQEKQDATHKETWICSRCGAVIEWLPPRARSLPPSEICCLSCQKAKKGVEAHAKAPVEIREAPRRADQQRRRADGSQDRRAPVPRGLTIELVELSAYRVGIPQHHVQALLAALRSHLTPSSDK